MKTLKRKRGKLENNSHLIDTKRIWSINIPPAEFWNQERSKMGKAIKGNLLFNQFPDAIAPTPVLGGSAGTGQNMLNQNMLLMYSNYRNYAPLLDVKGGIITEKVFPVFSESFFWTCFGLVMYIWVLMDVTEKLAFQM